MIVCSKDRPVNVSFLSKKKTKNSKFHHVKVSVLKEKKRKGSFSPLDRIYIYMIRYKIQKEERMAV